MDPQTSFVITAWCRSCVVNRLQVFRRSASRFRRYSNGRLKHVRHCGSGWIQTALQWSAHWPGRGLMLGDLRPLWVIVASFVFEHVEDWYRGVKKVLEAPNPEGALYFKST